MRRLPVPAVCLALCLLCAGPAWAQDVQPSIEMDLWCGVAFDLAVRDVPETAAPEVKSVTDPYRAGAEMLLGRAEAAYLEIGLTEDGFADLLADTEADVTRQLASTDPAISPPHSFEACAELIGL